MSDWAEFELRHPHGVTPIVVGPGALVGCAPRLESWLRGRSLFVVTSPRVLDLHGQRLEPLRALAAGSTVLTVPEGEAAKTAAEASRLWAALLAAGGKRDSRLMAFGGGSVGDLAGFVAGTFLRGIEFCQLPTTLLAQVDAAIGGKTGIDLPAAKNAVGLFHHPRFVVCDPEVLGTLPREELRSGLAEVVKKAFLLDPSLFERLETDLDALLTGEVEALTPVVAAAARAKAAVVTADPGEQGGRVVLNFGHTLGHALETVLGYRGLRHGEAVAYGMLFATRVALARGLAAEAAERLRRLLARCDWPDLPEVAAAELCAAMAHDKKAREAGLRWVLPTALGGWRLAEEVPVGEIADLLPSFLADPWAPAPGWG